MSAPFDWAEDDWQDDFESEDEYLAYLEWLGDLDEPWESLSPVVERIRAYTAQDEATTQMEIAAVEAYIESGIEDFERLLSNHAAFDAYLAERSEDVA